MALDSEQNRIQRKDIVRVIDGPHCGRQAEIRHIYRSFAYLYSRMMTENGGIFVCKTRHLLQAGLSTAPVCSSSPALAYMSPARISSPMHPSSGGGRGNLEKVGIRGGVRTEKGRHLIGETVKVIQGPYKNHVGFVKVIYSKLFVLKSCLIFLLCFRMPPSRLFVWSSTP